MRVYTGGIVHVPRAPLGWMNGQGASRRLLAGQDSVHGSRQAHAALRGVH